MCIFSRCIEIKNISHHSLCIFCISACYFKFCAHTKSSIMVHLTSLYMSIFNTNAKSMSLLWSLNVLSIDILMYSIFICFIIRTNINIILLLAAVQPSPVSRLMAAWLGFLHIPDLHSQWPRKEKEKKKEKGLRASQWQKGLASTSSILEILLLSCTLPMLIAWAHAGSERATSPLGWISPLHLDIILPPAMICVSRLEFNSP